MGLSLDTSAWESAFAEYLDASQKDAVEALNKKGLDLAYRAAQKTGITAESKVRTELLGNPKMLAALTSLYLKRHGIKVPKGQFAVEMQKFVDRRVASTRYLRVGWAPAIEALGGTFRGRGNRALDYIHGFADKATIVDLLTEIAWIIDEPTEGKAASAEEIGFKAMQEALDFVAEDMMIYVERKMRERAEEFSK